MLLLLFSLQQLDQLLAEQSHLFSELGLSDWKGERKAQNKQAFPDPADAACPQCGHSKLMLQRVPSKNLTATGSLSASGLEPPSRQFPTRTTSEPNLPKSSPWELSTSKKEMKRPLQEKMDFKCKEMFLSYPQGFQWKGSLTYNMVLLLCVIAIAGVRTLSC